MEPGDRCSDDDRDLPSRTDVIGSALSEVIGGPVGRRALIGRTRLFTPLRVMFVIALVLLALGWSTKAACLQTTGSGAPSQRVANWENQRAYYELCYSDTVPLYGAELLSQGKFPYKSSWLELDSTGQPQTQYDGSPAVRYMEYPVLTGVYQYLAMSLAKTYTLLAVATGWPVLNGVAEVVMFFNFAAGPNITMARLGAVRRGQRQARTRRTAIGGVEEDLLVRAAQQTPGFDRFFMLLRQLGQLLVQHVDGGDGRTGFDQALRIEPARARIGRVDAAQRLGQPAHQFEVAQIAQLQHQRPRFVDGFCVGR